MSCCAVTTPRLRRSYVPYSRPLCPARRRVRRSEEHTSELQSRSDLVCRLLLEKKKKQKFRNDDSTNYMTTQPVLATTSTSSSSESHKAPSPTTSQPYITVLRPVRYMTDTTNAH